MTGIMENAFINVKNRSQSITAEVDIPKGGGEGVILCQGGRFAGWSLYMKDGKPSYVHNWVGKERYTITAPQRVPAGQPVGVSGVVHAALRARAVLDGAFADVRELKQD